MRDDEIVQGLLDEMVTVLTTAAIPGVASVLPSTSAEDLVFQDAYGQLPAIGVVEVSGESAGPYAVGQKRHRARVSFELSIAVQDESSAAAGRVTARQIWGRVTKALQNHRSQVAHALGSYQHDGWGWAEHPRPELQLLTVRFHIDALLGNE